MSSFRQQVSKIPRSSGGFPEGGFPFIPSPSARQLRLYALGIAGAAFLYFGYNSLYNVDGGHRSIKYNKIRGILPTVYGEGTHIRIPWLERAYVFDVRARPKSIASLTGTKDLQMVDISIRVLYKPDITSLPQIYRELGHDYDERVLPSIVNEVLKSVVAQFNASQLITQREKVSLLVRQRLLERAQGFHIKVDDVSITSIQFSELFASAVEQKQIALQQAQRAAFLVDKARQEKESIILRAEGEAKSARLIGEAVAQNPAFLQLRRIEAAREIAGTLTKSQNRIMLNSENLLISALTDHAKKQPATI